MDAKELQRENQRLKSRLLEANSQHSAVVAQHSAVVAQFNKQVEEKQQTIAALQHEISLLLQRIKGSRQERIDPDQLLLFSVEELEEFARQLDQGDPQDDLIDERPKKKRRRSPGRQGKLPGHLPREVLRHELPPPEQACPCCGESRQEIGVVSSEQLELIPAQLKVIQHDRVKYACPQCQEHVATAAKPPQPIEKGLPGPGLCSHTVLSKFGDHVPMYRQEDIHSRLGMTIRRSTLCGWQVALSQLSLPLVLRMKCLLLLSKVIHTDDTSIKMLQPGAGTTQTAKFWPYLGDWLHPYAVYDFTLTRKRDGPQQFLAGYSGYLQADAYSGYDRIYASASVREVGCWVHARRYWHQAGDNDPERSNMALGYIARLSQIESQLRKVYPPKNLQGERDFEAIAAARQEHAVPILCEFKQWLDTETESRGILPKSPIRTAFTYTTNQWDALTRYVEQGYLAYDNNAAERLVKIPALGRKNYLFVGGKRGGEDAAVMYSLVSSAKANGVEPFAWLKDLFTRLPYHRQGEAFQQAKDGGLVTTDELDYLLPDVWLKSHSDSVWTIDAIRREERAAKND